MPTIAKDEYVLVFQAKGGERVALPCTKDLSQGGYCILARTADGEKVPVSVQPMRGLNELGILAQTNDGETVPVVFAKSEIDVAVLAYYSIIRTYPFREGEEDIRDYWAINRNGSNATSWNISSRIALPEDEQRFIGPVNRGGMIWAKDGSLYRHGVRFGGYNTIVKHKASGEIDKSFDNETLSQYFAFKAMLTNKHIYANSINNLIRFNSKDASGAYLLSDDFSTLAEEYLLSPNLFGGRLNSFLYNNNKTYFPFQETSSGPNKVFVGAIGENGDAESLSFVEGPEEIRPSGESNTWYTYIDRLSDGRWIMSMRDGVFVFSPSFEFLQTLMDFEDLPFTEGVSALGVDVNDNIYIAGNFEKFGYKNCIKFKSNLEVDDDFLFGKIGNLPDPLTELGAIVDILVQGNKITLLGQRFKRGGSAAYLEDRSRCIWRMVLDGSTDYSFLNNSLAFRGTLREGWAPYGIDVKSGENYHARWPGA